MGSSRGNGKQNIPDTKKKLCDFAKWALSVVFTVLVALKVSAIGMGSVEEQRSDVKYIEAMCGGEGGNYRWRRRL